MLDTHTIRSLFMGGATLGAKGIALIAGVVLAQWLAFGDVQADHERRITRNEQEIQEISRRVYQSYQRNGTLWKRSQCVEMKRDAIPIPPGECDHIFDEIDKEMKDGQRNTTALDYPRW